MNKKFQKLIMAKTIRNVYGDDDLEFDEFSSDFDIEEDDKDDLDSSKIIFQEEIQQHFIKK